MGGFAGLSHTLTVQLERNVFGTDQHTTNAMVFFPTPGNITNRHFTLPELPL